LRLHRAVDFPAVGGSEDKVSAPGISLPVSPPFHADSAFLLQAFQIPAKLWGDHTDGRAEPEQSRHTPKCDPSASCDQNILSCQIHKHGKIRSLHLSPSVSSVVQHIEQRIADARRNV